MTKNSNSVSRTGLSSEESVRIVIDEVNIRPEEVKYSCCSITEDGLSHIMLITEYLEIESYLDPEAKETRGLLVVPVHPTSVHPTYPGNMINIQNKIARKAADF